MPAGTSPKRFSINPFIRDDHPSGFLPGAIQPQSPRSPFQFHPQVTRYMEEMQEQVYQELKKKAAQIEHEAYEKGFAQGEKDGQESGQKRLEVVIKQINALLSQIENQKKVLFPAIRTGHGRIRLLRDQKNPPAGIAIDGRGHQMTPWRRL
ncbi:MAG: hypothetical protein EHM75_04635 [Desulfobacteraceae bacterium]|nr:MAG: hypothetical protein EHM75_04635 [Desulfobacteraceae bacterium]